MFSLIACVGKNREIGKNKNLIFRIKDDMKFFKETTTGHKVVMGRKTWESLPMKLPGRENIVVSRGEMRETKIKQADKAINDLEEFIKENDKTDEEIFVIGGGAIYNEFIKHAKKIYLTEVDAEEEKADTYFPEFDREKYTREVLRKGKENDLKYEILLYTKK